MEKPKTMRIDDVEYIRKDSVTNEQAQKLDGLRYCMIRTYSAGVFAGYLKEINGKIGTVLQARRIYYWDGAASLSQLATAGTSKPENCKFPCEVTEVILTEIIEVIPCTEKARLSIKGVKVWKK